MDTLNQESEEYLEKKAKITALLERTLKKKVNLPDFYFAYMAGIICEEPPMNSADLWDYISPYLLDGKAMNETQGKAIAGDIHAVLIKDKLITAENKFVYSAERLEAPLILNNVELVKEKTEEDIDYSKTYTGGQPRNYFPTKTLMSDKQIQN